MRKQTTKKLSHEDIISARHGMSKDIDTYNKRSMVRTLGGVVLIGAGISTYMIPFTTAPLCIAGAGLIGYDVKALLYRYRYERHLVKLRCLKFLGVWHE